MEFWYGGKLFVSDAGTTPFGDPVEKRFMGSLARHQERDFWKGQSRTSTEQLILANAWMDQRKSGWTRARNTTYV